MNKIHIAGVWVAEFLQHRTCWLEDFWLFATKVGDTKTALLIVFPFTFFSNRRAGVTVFWVAIIAEWLNLVLKWVLFGQRPYWWIEESQLFVGKKPNVHQFPVTCETGPGSPSGHVMVTAAVWWVVVSSVRSVVPGGMRRVKTLPYVLYGLLLVTVGISRIYILAHFPHQVIAGCIAGYYLGKTLRNGVPSRHTFSFYVGLSFSMLVGTLGIFAGLQWLNVNLSWSVAMAKKWCNKPEWIHLDTAPLSSLARDCGSLFGLGLVQLFKPGGWALSVGPRAWSLFISLVVLQLMDCLPISVTSQLVFYGLHFVKFTLVPLIVMVIVPGLVQLIAHKHKKL